MKGKELRLEIAQFRLGSCCCFLSVLLAAFPPLLIRLKRRHQLCLSMQQLMCSLVCLVIQALLSPSFLQEVNHLLMTGLDAGLELPVLLPTHLVRCCCHSSWPVTTFSRSLLNDCAVAAGNVVADEDSIS